LNQDTGETYLYAFTFLDIGLIRSRMKLKSRVLTFIFIIIPVLVIDQITKIIARNELQTGKVFSYLDGMLRIQYAENPGAFLGWGSTLPPIWRTILFSILPFILLAVLAASILRSSDANWSAVTGAALIFGGGLGNLIDRLIFQGMVTDFALMKVGPLRTGIFNIADVAITSGVILLILYHVIREPFKKAQL